MLPDFINIGAMKCGATSLHAYLEQHPDIGISAVKEPNYFRTDREFQTRRSWYEGLFSPGKRLYGECSPDYTKYLLYPGVPERMKSLLPGVKLIYLVRDPVKRLESHIWHNLVAGRESSLAGALGDMTAQNKYIHCSLYADQLKRYEDCFPRSQIMPVVFELLRDEPATAISRILDFIGADPAGLSEISFEPQHSTEGKRVASLPLRLARKLPGFEGLSQTLPSGARSAVKRVFSHAHHVQRPQLTVEQKQRLNEIFAPDIDRLERSYGLTLNHWKGQS